MAKVTITIEDVPGEPGQLNMKVESDPPIPNPINPKIKAKILKQMTSAQQMGYQMFGDMLEAFGVKSA